ncbi:hypothetical protein FUA23_02680 [Neolewinella aurantiaca]|uniref:2TM domain-containing protein n=1 Tax=Neolewinella aurantiaca TaxID=2602767 RepID=A0A5C7FIZ5_9BACT|nr:2TM domain-containing protein [Neolewinella aurantiaca]TXF91152.1 hypothetical protein FUA23_02680 [Neolewinella aurantiaca]
MEPELREEAEKRVKAKVAFYQTALIFSGVIVVLLMLSFYLPGAAIWLRLPIPILLVVLGVVFLSAFGLPVNGKFTDNWREDEVAKEIDKLRRRRKVQLPPMEDLSETEILELKELERLQNKWDDGEGGYV